MRHPLKTLLLSATLAAAGAAMAQAPQPPAGGEPHRAHPMMARMDPAKMQEHMARRQADLKAKLNLSAGQEAAWNSYVAAMKPPADLREKMMNPEARRKMHEEFAAMTTPQRIERMNAMKGRRDAEIARRNEATLSFYAALTPEQKKTFDERSMRRGGPRGGAHRAPALS